MNKFKNKVHTRSDDRGDYAYIVVSGRKIYFDLNNLEKIKQHRWHICHNGYARTCIGGRQVSMQCILLPPEVGKTVDHIDQCKLNNRMYNLRLASHRDNVVNGSRRKRTGRRKYPYLGIVRRKGRWQAKLGYKHRDFFSPTFATAREAGMAYDIMAELFNGVFASLNFLADDPRRSEIADRLDILHFKSEKLRIDALPAPAKPRYRGLFIAHQEPLRFSYSFFHKGIRYRGKEYQSEEEALMAQNHRLAQLPDAVHRIQQPRSYGAVDALVQFANAA